VKHGVVALDYDGTIAERGALHPAVRTAIAGARERDVAVGLVTGGILDELR
jgi:hydroxymethylpyrimidine pyrophosphatase-like HAD family hydrolase